MYKGLSEETIRSEMGEEAIIYTARPKGAENTFVMVPSGNNESAVYFFLSENDASHFGYLLSNVSPSYKDVELEVIQGPVGAVLDASEKDNFAIAIVPPNEAKKFFEEFEEHLANYYQL